MANGFVDIATAQSDLSALGLQPQFPMSEAWFENQSGNQSAAALLENLTSQGISANLSGQYQAQLLLPEYLEYGGKNYYFSDRVVQAGLPSTIPQNATGANATFDFEAYGNQVASIVPGSLRIG